MGVVPRFIWPEHRQMELLHAILRWAHAGRGGESIVREWATEIHSLSTEIQSLKSKGA